MSSNIDWIFPTLRKPFCGHYIWNLGSWMTVSSVGIFSKFILGTLNNTVSHNTQAFNRLLDARGDNVPLITVSNHHSCFDDPGMWGCLNLQHLCNRKTMRWSLAAHDICFTNSFHSYFFMLGKCIPVIRGSGVYQEAVNFCVERLSQGEWVHVFPEGKVNMTKEFIRLKWGVGRMVYESPILPIVVPIWHIGMEEVLPNEPPYFLKVGKNVTFNFGDPIELEPIVKELRSSKAPEEHARQVITEKIQSELMALKDVTESLHEKHYFV